MNGTNWFNAAAAPGGGTNLGASSSSLFGNSGGGLNNNNQPQQQPGGGGLFGNSSTTNNNLSGSTLFGGLNNNNNNNGGIPNSPSSAAFGGQTRPHTNAAHQDIPATEYTESLRLQNKYLESFTPGGNKKKSAAAKTTSSPTGGPMGFTEPSRFGSNSLYGSGAGVSPNKSSHRLSNNTTSNNRPPGGGAGGDYSQSTSSPLGNSSMSVRSRMSTGGSASENLGSGGERSGHGYSYTGYGGMGEDPERPPVRSYADEDGAELTGQGGAQGQGQGMGMGGGMDDDEGMRFDDDTDGPAHMLMVYGLPPSKQDRLQSFLSQFGTLTHFQVGPMDSNYIVVAFDDPGAAARLQRQSGTLRMDGWYLGFRGVSEGAVPEAWSRSRSRSRSAGGRQHAERDQGHAESNAMDLRPPSSTTGTATTTNNNNQNSDDPFASISTLTPIKSGGSVFRPSATSASSGQQQQQQKVDPRFAFGTGQQSQQQPQQQQQAQSGAGGGYGFFGKISDVMFGH